MAASFVQRVNIMHLSQLETHGGADRPTGGRRRTRDEAQDEDECMTKTILGAGVLALAVAGSSFAFGHCAGGDRGCSHDMLMGGGRILHTLDLSDEQKQKVQDILTAHQPKLRQLVSNETA